MGSWAAATETFLRSTQAAHESHRLFKSQTNASILAPQQGSPCAEPLFNQENKLKAICCLQKRNSIWQTGPSAFGERDLAAGPPFR